MNIENFIKTYGNKFEPLMRDKFNSLVLWATDRAQRKYGFDMGITGKNTHNNEADAFKHTYMQWFLAYYISPAYAKQKGDEHEDETPNAPLGERNMDLWNNAIGREIAYEMKKNPNHEYWTDIITTDYASRKIVEKMRQGELITHPYDPRKFENMEYERLTENDRLYYRGEFNGSTPEQIEKIQERYLEQAIDNNWKIPERFELENRVQTGELIYVNSYIKADGTKVSGYYRRKPIR